MGAIWSIWSYITRIVLPQKRIAEEDGSSDDSVESEDEGDVPIINNTGRQGLDEEGEEVSENDDMTDETQHLVAVEELSSAATTHADTHTPLTAFENNEASNGITTGRGEDFNTNADVRFPTDTDANTSTNTSTNTDLMDFGEAAVATAAELEEKIETPGRQKYRKRENNETMTDTTNTDEAADTYTAANVRLQPGTDNTEETESSSTSAIDRLQIQVPRCHTPGDEPVTNIITTTNTSSSSTDEDTRRGYVENNDHADQTPNKENRKNIATSAAEDFHSQCHSDPAASLSCDSDDPATRQSNGDVDTCVLGLSRYRDETRELESGESWDDEVQQLTGQSDNCSDRNQHPDNTCDRGFGASDPKQYRHDLGADPFRPNSGGPVGDINLCSKIIATVDTDGSGSAEMPSGLNDLQDMYPEGQVSHHAPTAPQHGTATDRVCKEDTRSTDTLLRMSEDEAGNPRRLEKRTDVDTHQHGEVTQKKEKHQARQESQTARSHTGEGELISMTKDFTDFGSYDSSKGDDDNTYRHPAEHCAARDTGEICCADSNAHVIVPRPTAFGPPTAVRDPTAADVGPTAFAHRDSGDSEPENSPSIDGTAQEDNNSSATSSQSSQNIKRFTSDTGHSETVHGQTRTLTPQSIESAERKEEVLLPWYLTPIEARKQGDEDFHTHRPRPSASRRLEDNFQDDDVVDSAIHAQEKQTTVRKHEGEGNVVETPRRHILRDPIFASTPQHNEDSEGYGISLTVNESTSPFRGEERHQDELRALQQTFSNTENQDQILQQQLSEKDEDISQPLQTTDEQLASTPQHNEDSAFYESGISLTVNESTSSPRGEERDQDELQAPRQALTDTENHVQNLQQQLSEKDEAIGQLRQANNELQEKVSDQNEKIEELQRDLRRKKDTTKKLQALQREVNKKDDELREAEEEKNRLEGSLRDEVNDLQRQLTDLSFTCSELETKLSDTESTLHEEQQQKNKEVQCLTRIITQETTQKDAALTAKQQLERDIDQLVAEKDNLSETVENLRQQLGDGQRKIQSLTETVGRENADKELLGATNRELSENLQGLQSTKNNLEGRLLQLTGQLTRVQTQRVVWKIFARNLLSSLEDTAERCETLQRELTLRDEAMREADEERGRLERSHHDEVTRLQLQLVDLDRTCNRLATQNSQLSHTADSLREAEQQSKAQVQCLTRVLSQESTQKDAALAAKLQLESEIGGLVAERDNLRDILKNLRHELGDRERRIHSLTEAVAKEKADKEKVRATNRELSAQLQGLQCTKNSLEDRLNQLTGQLTRVQTQRVVWKMFAGKLLSSLDELKKNHDAVQKDLSDQRRLTESLQHSLKAALSGAEEVRKECILEKRLLEAQHHESLNTLQQDMARKTEAIIQLEAEKASLSREVTSLRQQLEGEEQLRAASESETGDLRGQLEELTSDQTRKDELIFSLSQSLSREKSEKEKAQALHRQLASTIATLTSDQTSAEETLAECRQQLGSFKTQRLVWKFLAIKHGCRIRSMETSLQGLQQELQSERNVGNSHTRSLRDALNRVESTRSLLVEEQRKNQAIETEAAELRDAITRLEEEVKLQKDFAHNVTGEKANLEEDRRQLGEKIRGLESQVQHSRKEMERAILQNRAVEEQKKSLEAQLAGLSQQFIEIQTQTTNTQLSQFTAQLRAKERELADTSAHKDARINELTARLRQLEEERRPMEVEAQRLREMQDCLREAQETNQQLEQNIASLNDELSSSSAEITALEREQEGLRSRLREKADQIHRQTQECEAARDQLRKIMVENQRLQLQLETLRQGGRR